MRVDSTGDDLVKTRVGLQSNFPEPVHVGRQTKTSSSQYQVVAVIMSQNDFFIKQ